MRQLTAFVTLALLTLTSLGQDRKDLILSFSAGTLNTPSYKNAHARFFYGCGFDYHVEERHILAAHYLSGKHWYFDDVSSNTPPSEFIILPYWTNADVTYNAFTILYKYKIVNSPKFSIVPGAGMGVLTYAKEYPYTEGTRTDIRMSANTGAAFPVSLEVTYKLSKHWQFGLTGGFLHVPDMEPITALHAGPRSSYVFK